MTDKRIPFVENGVFRVFVPVPQDQFARQYPQIGRLSENEYVDFVRNNFLPNGVVSIVVDKSELPRKDDYKNTTIENGAIKRNGSV